MVNFVSHFSQFPLVEFKNESTGQFTQDLLSNQGLDVPEQVSQSNVPPETPQVSQLLIPPVVVSEQLLQSFVEGSTYYPAIHLGPQILGEV